MRSVVRIGAAQITRRKLSNVVQTKQSDEVVRQEEGVVLGLSPNAARLSVRFWVEESLGDFTQHLQQHWTDLKLDPPPHPWPTYALAPAAGTRATA